MTSGPVFQITYWGVTGSLSAPLRPSEVTDKLVAAVCRLVGDGMLAGLQPGPGLEDATRRAVETLPFHLRTSYGGNTTCVEVTTPDATLIFDCGSGFRELGVDLACRWQAAGAAARRRVHVMVTHPHMDHTYATPFFSPYYDPANHFTLWGTREVLNSLAAVLDPDSSLSHIYFPPSYDEMKAIREFRHVTPGEEFRIGETRVRTLALNHPGGSLAYRLDCRGRSFVFATDHEQTEVPDRRLAGFARDADLLYTEGQYTAAEYEGKDGVAGDPPLSRRGWGHSPVEACVTTAVASGVRAVHIGHRDPRRNDEQLAAMDAAVRRLAVEELRKSGRPDGSCEALVPYEGLTVRL